LNKLADFMFRETTATRDCSAGLVFWNGALGDLHELAAMKELATYEWKDSVVRYIQKGPEKVEAAWPAKQLALKSWKGHKKYHSASQCECGSDSAWSVKTYVQEACAAVVATVAGVTGVGTDSAAKAIPQQSQSRMLSFYGKGTGNAKPAPAKRAFGPSGGPASEEEVQEGGGGTLCGRKRQKQSATN
jgi:hypothetical protein